MSKSINQTLLDISKGDSLLEVTYTFLMLSNYAMTNAKHIRTCLDLESLRSKVKEEIINNWPEFVPIPNYMDQLDNDKLQKIIGLVLSLNTEFKTIEPEIRKLISHYTTRIGLSHTPTELKNLISSIVNHYQTQYELNHFFDFNARSGDLLSEVMSLSYSQQPAFYFEEANPIMFQIAQMLFKLSGAERLTLSNCNSLVQSKFIQNKMKVDCVVSYPRLSIILGDEESHVYKPYLSVPLKNADKINSPEALYIQLVKHCLTESGIGIIVVSDGFLSRHGYDKEVRNHFIKKNIIEAVISLPNNLYTGTTLSTSLIILNHNRTPDKKIHFINLAQLGLDKDNINKTCKWLNYPEELDKAHQISISPSIVLENAGSLRPVDYLDEGFKVGISNSTNASKKLDIALNEYLVSYQIWLKNS